MMRTTITRDHVLYQVLDPEQVWARIVRFSARNRAGGPAFVAAAREQERYAHERAQEKQDDHEDVG
jgi:hypothetical protein